MRLPMRINTFVYIRHEIIEMGATLALNRQQRKEKIHQHGLASTDFAMHIEALYRLQRLPALTKQPAQRTRFTRKPLGANLFNQLIIALSEIALRIISFNIAGSLHSVITFSHRWKSF